MRKAVAAVAGVLLGIAGVVAVPATTPAQAAAPGSLGALAAARGRYFGSSVDSRSELNDVPYRAILSSEFGLLMPGNAMQWDATEPIRGQFNFTSADQVVTFAEQNGQSVRGQNLVWHSHTPAWLQSLDAAGLRAALRNHITTLVSRYRGRLAAWDVVNEVLTDSGTLRNTFWLQRLGPDYIAEAFRLARAADPNVKLYINDFNIEGSGPKSDGLYDLVRSLLAQGVPVDGVGFQSHLSIHIGLPSGMRENLQRFADLGLEVAITELDVRMRVPVDGTKLAAQAGLYRDVTTVCLVVPRCAGITVRTFSDKYSFVPLTFPGEGAATLSDVNFVRKPAYTAVRDALLVG